MNEPVDQRVGAALVLRPSRPEEPFAAVMARELARAPWFAISAAMHAVLFFVLDWFTHLSAPVKTPAARVELVLPIADADALLPEPPEEKVTIDPADQDLELAEPTLAATEPEPQQSAPAFDPDAFAPGYEGVGLTSWRGGGKGGGGSAGDDIFGFGSDALRRGGLRTTVKRLRQSGLEIVFVFDSTASMTEVLDSAKRSIFRMVEALHALVPRARIGIVTYRDRGSAEEYLTRTIPVTNDVYRVMNFMHTIRASGGGDIEEAVLDGLKTATSQRWLPDSRRVVVLIGDAPPHAADEPKLRSAVRAFANADSTVHAIPLLTGFSSETRRKTPKFDSETQRTFASIAKDGKGQCVLLERADRVLLQVMTLAFGAEHSRDLDEIYALVDKRTQRTEVSVLDAVHRGDLGALGKALRRAPVDDEFVKAAIKLGKPAITRFLIERLADSSYPPHSRQACSYAVMQLLQLDEPPLDPEVDTPLRQAEMQELLARVPG
jgi:hypothetical protein